MSGFFGLSPSQLPLLAAVLGVLAARSLDSDEQQVLGNFFSSLGQTIQTVAAQKDLLQSKQEQLQELEELKQKICKLEQQVRKK